MMAFNHRTQETGEVTCLDAESFTSYSLNFEDVILRRLFPTQRTGFYVDVGAGHPRFENDTYSLYLRGWRGINIEPNLGFHAALVEERPRDINLNVVLSDRFGGALTYYELDGSGLSTCDVEQATVYRASGRDVVPREVPVTTLSDILTDAGTDHVDLLKVDVEGFEENVLIGNDWEKFRPDVVLVEATYPESPVRRPSKIRNFMEQRGYRHVHFDGLNDFYVEREFSAPEGLTLPPNVFDRFVPREIADLRSQAESLRTHFDEALRNQTDLRSQVESLKTHFDEALRNQTDLRNRAESLQIDFDEALRTADTLAVENRRIGHQAAHLVSENRRLREAAEQMRAELLALNRLLEPLHIVAEQMERLRQKSNDLNAANARLASVYSSLSWRLTAPLRWCDEIQRLVIARLRKFGKFGEPHDL